MINDIIQVLTILPTVSNHHHIPNIIVGSRNNRRRKTTVSRLRNNILSELLPEQLADNTIMRSREIRYPAYQKGEKNKKEQIKWNKRNSYMLEYIRRKCYCGLLVLMVARLPKLITQICKSCTSS